MILFCIPFAIYTYTVGYIKLTGKNKGFVALLNPMTISIVIGVIFGLFKIPVIDVLGDIVSSLSSCVSPVSMLMTGIVLSSFPVLSLFKDYKSYIIVCMRLILMPLILVGICFLCSLKSMIPMVLFMATMPTGLNTIIFAKNSGQSPELGARLAFLSHLFSIITLPIWLSII